MAFDFAATPASTAADAGAPAGRDLRAQAERFWRARTPQEQWLIGAMLFVVGAALIWWIGVQPALKTLREAPVEIDRLDRQIQQMQLAAAEAQGLRGSSQVTTQQAVAALQAATERLGPSAKLLVQGERATLTFTAVPAETLRGWLNEARSGARVRPVEAQWTKSGDGYSGNVVVLLGGTT